MVLEMALFYEIFIDMAQKIWPENLNKKSII